MINEGFSYLARLIPVDKSFSTTILEVDISCGIVV